MKAFFEEPAVEVTLFAVEDTVTASGMRGLGMSSGFDEVEPNRFGGMDLSLIPPCLS